MWPSTRLANIYWMRPDLYVFQIVDNVGRRQTQVEGAMLKEAAHRGGDTSGDGAHEGDSRPAGEGESNL